MTYAVYAKRCPRGHPVDSDECFYCKQEDHEQEKRDDKLCEQIKRLVKRGKLSKEILIGE